MAAKTGSVAIWEAIRRACGTVKRYSNKILLAIAAAEASGLITSDEATIAKGFVTGADALCSIYQRVAGY